MLGHVTIKVDHHPKNNTNKSKVEPENSKQYRQTQALVTWQAQFEKKTCNKK